MPDNAERDPRQEAAPADSLDVNIPDPVLAGDYQMRILALSDKRDEQLRRELEMWRNGWRACEVALGDQFAAGWEACDADWHRALGPARAAARHAARSATFAELEEQRWGPGGRKHFADPRPGDFTGRSEAA
jgi:hypothetical protein